MKLLLSPLSIGQLVCTGELVKIASLLKWTPYSPGSAPSFCCCSIAEGSLDSTGMFGSHACMHMVHV